MIMKREAKMDFLKTPSGAEEARKMIDLYKAIQEDIKSEKDKEKNKSNKSNKDNHNS